MSAPKCTEVRRTDGLWTDLHLTMAQTALGCKALILEQGRVIVLDQPFDQESITRALRIDAIRVSQCEVCHELRRRLATQIDVPEAQTTSPRERVGLYATKFLQDPQAIYTGLYRDQGRWTHEQLTAGMKSLGCMAGVLGPQGQVLFLFGSYEVDQLRKHFDQVSTEKVAHMGFAQLSADVQHIFANRYNN